MRAIEPKNAAEPSAAPRASRLAACAAALLICAAIGAAFAGCGTKPQDTNAKQGTWKVQVKRWDFAKTQLLGQPQKFRLVITNVDTTAVPQLILTIDGMQIFVKQPGVAMKTRPVWIPDEVTYAGVTPYNSATATSYNLGVLPAGATKTYTLRVTPIRRGEHRIAYRLAGDLYGKAKVADPGGNPAADSRSIAIDPTPHIDRSLFK